MNSKQRRKVEREIPTEQRDEINALRLQYRILAGHWPRKRYGTETPDEYISSLQYFIDRRRELKGGRQDDIVDASMYWQQVFIPPADVGSRHLSTKAPAAQTP